MEVKHITWISLSSWRPSQKKRHLSVGYSLLWKIIIDDEGMLPIVSEIFSNCTSRIWGQELKGGSFRGSCSHNNSVFKSLMVPQCFDDVGNSWSLLSDGHVDTEKLFLGISGIKVSFLVDNGINSNGCFSSLSVPNDQLSLPSADWD